MGRSLRVLVANRPKLMRELILATLSDEPGIEIVGEVSDEAEIRQRVSQTSPDLLVIALDEPAQQNCSVFYWASFDIHSSQIEPSEQGILNAVRNITPARAGERV
jgi:AmiR/NasT family two-component response regulator